MAIDYIAQHAYYLAKAVIQIGGGEFKGDSYVELAYPDVAKKDERSAEEIKQHVLRLLSE